MPRATPDYRAARAVLAAPYPLPVIFTRNATADQASSSTRPALAQPSLIPVNNTPHGFPLYNTNWRDLPPAIPPVPYPEEVTNSTEGAASHAPSRGARRVKLVKRKLGDDAETGEYELMSGIEEEVPGKELRIAREIGAWSLNVGRYTAAQAETRHSHSNVLTTAGQANIPAEIPPPVRAGHASPVYQALQGPLTPHAQAARVPSSLPPRAIDIGPLPSLGSPARITPISRHNRPIVRPSADASSDDDSSDSDGSLTAVSFGLKADPGHVLIETQSPRIVTPSSHIALCRSSKTSTPSRTSKSSAKPLFLGQTGLSPFTYMPPPKHRRSKVYDSSADEAGCETEATVRGTVTRIARSRHKRGNRKPAAEPLIKPSSAPSTSTDKAHYLAFHPKSASKSSEHAALQSAAPHVWASPAATDLAGPPAAHRTPDIPGANTWRPVRSLPKRFASPASVRSAPSCPSGYQAFGPSATDSEHNLTQHRPPSVPEFTFTMPFPAIAPQAASSPQHCSLPNVQPGNVPTTSYAASSTNTAPQLHNISQAGAANQALSSSAGALSDTASRTSATVPRRPELPIAKLCHNFLLAKKLHASNRRKLVRKHAKEVIQREKDTLENALSWQTKGIQLTPPPAKTHEPAVDSTATSGPTSMPFNGAFRPVSSMARVDEDRPPRKRRRANSSSSEDESASTARPSINPFSLPTMGRPSPSRPHPSQRARRGLGRR